jgi:hypothetical protein
VARSLLASRAVDGDVERRQIVGWYRELLESTSPPSGLRYEPIRIGPTWQYGDRGWLLPDFTLGWDVLAWCGLWLRDKRGQPWQFTAEQTRFLLWFYAVDPEMSAMQYHSAALQRLKGWGKDPLAACVAVAGMFADVTFDCWDGDVPVGREEPAAWVQVVAVSQEQTQNTMKLFPSLISPEARKRFGIQVGKRNVWGLGDTRQVQAVTSSPLAIEGPRPTLVIRNETQNWDSSNGGHEMAGAIEGNAAKSENGAARMLDILNAFRPERDSVGQRTREGFDATQGSDPTAVQFGLLYDSLEAPPDAPLTVEAIPDVIAAVRGDADWLSTRRIISSIMNPNNSASESRRKWFNQVSAAADARFDSQRLKLCAVDDELQPGDRVVLFGDGSKTGDATGLVGVRLSDGLTQVLHVQQPTRGQRADRDKVDGAVVSAFDRFDVVAFWFDPSHAKDEDAVDDDRYWWPMCDTWMGRYADRLLLWAVKSGAHRHAVAWDMTSSARQAQFVPAVEQLDADIDAGVFRFKRSTWLQQHLTNAKRNPGRFGVSLKKEHRESSRKIDLAVCAAGGQMLRRAVDLSGLAQDAEPNEAVFF